MRHPAGKIIALFTVLFILAAGGWLYLHIQAEKVFLKKNIINTLGAVLQRQVSIGSVDFDLQKGVQLNKVCILNAADDTLMFSEAIRVSIDKPLLSNRPGKLKKLSFRNARLWISNQPESDQQLPEKTEIRMPRLDVDAEALPVSATTALRYLLDPDNKRFDLLITKSRVDSRLLNELTTSRKLPEGWRMPAVLIASGTIKGTPGQIRPDLVLTGSYGKLTVKGTLSDLSDKTKALYDLKLLSTDFDLGRLLRKDSLFRRVSGYVSVQGAGLQPRTMQTALRADISSAEIKGNRYHSLSFQADFKNGKMEATASSPDTSLAFTAKATGDYTKAVTSYTGELQVSRWQLGSDTTGDAATLSFTARATVRDAGLRSPDVTLDIFPASIKQQERTVALEAIHLKAFPENDINVFELRSPFADLDGRGAFEYDKLVPALIGTLQRYFSWDEGPARAVPSQQVQVRGSLKPHPLLSRLLPGMRLSEVIRVDATYNGDREDSTLSIAAHAPGIEFGYYRFSNLHINASGTATRLRFVGNFDTLAGRYNALGASSFSGTAANDSARISFNNADNAGRPRYEVNMGVQKNANGYAFAFPDSLVLNYQRWEAGPGSVLTLRDKRIAANLALRNGTSSLTATTEPGPDAPLRLNFVNFDLANITAAVLADSFLVQGSANGELVFSDLLGEQRSVTGKLTVADLRMLRSSFGKLDFTATSANGVVTANAAISSDSNQVQFAGSFYPLDSIRSFEGKLDVTRLQLAGLKNFSRGYVSRSSGSVTGTLQFGGSLRRPQWNGELTVQHTRFTLSQLGTLLNVDAQKVQFAYPDIRFNNFIINDSSGHPFSVNGHIRERSATEYLLGLQLKARDFSLMHAPKAINNQLFGIAVADIDLSVTGRWDDPALGGDILLKAPTSLTLILPQRSLDKEAAETVTRFVDLDTFSFPSRTTFRPTPRSKLDMSAFFEKDLRLRIDSTALLDMVIDPATGDALRMQGNGVFKLGLSPQKIIGLDGSYVLSQGQYLLNPQYLNRRFELRAGGTIRFTGQPVDGAINIAGDYLASTSPRDLLSNEVGEVDPRLAYSFREKLPFHVGLTLRGALEMPQIDFDISLPEGEVKSARLRTTIQNKLDQLRSDVAATNKQVFALLVLNRFVGEQSTDFFKGTGGSNGFNNLARESVSKFLSAALDQIASDLFRGINVDLHKGDYQDFTTTAGARNSDLNIGMTKSFLDNRLSVTVGKYLGVEGQDGSAKAAKQKGSRFLPDATVDFKLSANGNSMVRGYSKNQFEVVLDGYVVESGVAFILRMDYDVFTELFSKRKTTIAGQ